MQIRYDSRLKEVRKHLAESRLDALFVTNKSNVSYLSGFTGIDSMLFISGERKYFITDSRYLQQARHEVFRDYSIVLAENSIYDTLKRLIRSLRTKLVGFEGMDLPYSVASRFRKELKNIGFMPCTNLVESIRSIKDRVEIKLIKNSVRITRRVFENTVKRIHAGANEIDIARSVTRDYIDNGSETAFAPIIASGRNTSMPHATPGKRIIKKSGFVMVDIGGKLNGYNSDMTRMVFLKAPDGKLLDMLNIVKSAQKRAIDCIRAGVMISDVDSSSRSYIEKKGYGKYFGHALGHGIGLDVHEAPSISSSNKNILIAGMVFTIEPAIYIPNFGGVRIEDMVLVTESGCEILSN